VAGLKRLGITTKQMVLISMMSFPQGPYLSQQSTIKGGKEEGGKKSVGNMFINTDDFLIGNNSAGKNVG